ncbi:SxtJ family membrane protein [Nitrospirota bacterium]
MIREELKQITSTKKDLRNFGLVVGGVILALGLWLLWKDRPATPCFLGTGAILMTLGLIAPKILLPLQRLWMSLAVVLGFIMTRVILTALFYLTITPIALIMRLFGKKFMPLGFDKNATTYWQPRSETKKPRETYEQQY